MGTAILRPNGVRANLGWTIGGGAATQDAAQSDNSDATYSAIAFPGTGAISAPLLLRYTTFAFPALSQIRSVTPRVRHGGGTNTGGLLYFVLGLADGSGSGQPGDTTAAAPAGAPGTIVTVSGSAKPTKTTGGGIYSAWTQADIDDLIMEFYTLSADDRVHESYIDVLYNEAPVPTLTAPTEGATVTTTTSPAVSWTYSDPEGDAQERYRVKVFAAAVNDAFAAGTDMRLASGAVYDSGDVLSNATSAAIGVSLLNGSYVVYVFVADVGSSGRYSTAVKVASGSTAGATYANQWTQNVPLPPAPTLTATPDPTNARVALAVHATAGPPTTEYFVMERSDDGGVTWVYVRGGLALTNPASGTSTVTLYDYEMPRDGALLYRARGVDTGLGSPVAGPESASQAVTLAGDCNSWLKSYTDSTKNIAFVHADTRFESKSSENLVVYETEGRADPIIHGGTIHTEAIGGIVLQFDNDAQWLAFEALRALKQPLLFQTVFGDTAYEQYWVRLGPDRSVIRLSSMRQHDSQDRTVTIAAREVRRPAVT